MGKLIDPERTRRAKEARRDRVVQILAAAEKAFLRSPYSEVTLDNIGRQAGVKQGQANLAFRSREELFMTIIRNRLREWYEALGRALGEGDDPMTREQIADLVARSLAERHELTRLLGPLHMALELHEDGMEVHTFLYWQRDQLSALAEAITARAKAIHKLDAFDALYRAQVVAAAVHPLSRPEGNLAVDLITEENQVFALDLEDEVSRIVLGSLGDA